MRHEARYLTALFVMLAALTVATSANATCSAGCVPVQKAGWSSNQFTVAFASSDFGDDDRNAIIAAMSFWKASDGTALFTFAPQGPAQVLITIDPSLVGSGNYAVRPPTDPNQGSTIQFNPEYLNRGLITLIEHVAAHELGHAQGLDHTTDWCEGTSVMNGGVSRWGPFVTSPGECDSQAMGSMPPPGGGGTIDPNNRDCSSDCSPLVLDLNGDGVRTTGVSNPVFFDLNGDGDRDRMTWTDPNGEEAFLWLDLVRNQRVDDGRELFGVGTVLPSGNRATDGFVALRAYDEPMNGGNGDGKISHADRIWSKLLLWVDRNHDGHSDSSEIQPIHASGVVELYLQPVTDMVPDEHGNGHYLRGQYLKRQPGGAHAALYSMDDVFFQPVP